MAWVGPQNGFVAGLGFHELADLVERRRLSEQ
jgi:hypothetical protein